jgi:2-polyprenyl-3-methyl-5-hydroxy-6-metoxy-1,4-benzoquinol methylase
MTTLTDGGPSHLAPPATGRTGKPARLAPLAAQDTVIASQIGRIFAWRRGFNAMHLVDIGLRLGMFRMLAEAHELTSRALAERLCLHAPYVKAWCATAYSFELLEADEGERFRLAPGIDEVLARPDHPAYQGGYVQLGTQFASEDFRHAADAFRSGSKRPFQGRSKAFARIVEEALAGINAMVAGNILPGIPGLCATLAAGGALLEVGCGTGNLLRQLAAMFPEAHCTGVDIDPTGLTVAREAMLVAGLARRINIVEGDVRSAVSSDAFDVVLMIEVLHELSPPIRPAVIAACARALRKGGWLVIVDETYPSTLAQTRQAEFLFPVQTGLEELTWGNIVPTREEQERLLRDAGFAGPIGRSLVGQGVTILSTRK